MPPRDTGEQRLGTGKESVMEVVTPLQIRQTNDCEILAFFNANDVRYSLTGDHLFVIHTERGDLHAGPGDWLVVGPDRQVSVDSGVYELHMRRAIELARAQHAGREAAGSR
jgi:hypothetical protein